MSFYMTRKGCSGLPLTSFEATSLRHFCLLHNGHAHQTPCKVLFGCSLPNFSPFASLFLQNDQKMTKFRVVGFEFQNLRSVDGAQTTFRPVPEWWPMTAATLERFFVPSAEQETSSVSQTLCFLDV